MGLEILVVVEVAVALHQAEAARVGQREAGHQQAPGVDQRAPEPFAGAREDRQPVGIVHLGTVVLARRTLVLAEVEHAGQRRQPEPGDAFAQV